MFNGAFALWWLIGYFRVPKVIGTNISVYTIPVTNFRRWLLDNDHDEEGLIVLANLHGGGDTTNENAQEEFREIKVNVFMTRQEGERTYFEMFRRYKSRLIIAMSSQAFAQLNGINVISYYVCALVPLLEEVR